MKVCRNIVLIIALIYSAQWTAHAQQDWQYLCSAQRDQCKLDATQSWEQCNNSCDTQYVPNTFEWDNCRANCGAVRTTSNSTCDAIYNDCTSSRSNECRYSVCSGYCGSGNDVLSGSYVETDQGGCNCQCQCNPGGRPSYCPGGPDAAGCSPTQGWVCNTPVLLSIDADRIRLTAPADGVLFDLIVGRPAQYSWTRADSSDAWLVLDRNGNGMIDDGTELFGSVTPQPAVTAPDIPQGFRALAVFDAAAEGGNEDGFIDAQDRVYGQLRLWRDANQNGISEPDELLTLQQADVGRLDLTYQTRWRQDRHGNYFRYRARVWDLQGRQRKWAWDVFLATAQE
jgi:hypothetical protein